MSKRAIRRHHYRRRVKEFVKIHQGWNIYYSHEQYDIDSSNEWARRMANTHKPCSCWNGCGNVSHSTTRQAYKAMWLEQEGLEEVGMDYRRVRSSAKSWW